MLADALHHFFMTWPTNPHIAKVALNEVIRVKDIVDN